MKANALAASNNWKHARRIRGERRGEAAEGDTAGAAVACEFEEHDAGMVHPRIDPTATCSRPIEEADRKNFAAYG